MQKKMTIASRYTLEKKLNDGFASEIWQAREIGKESDVIIKIILKNLRNANVEQLLRFQRDTEIIRQLGSDGCVRIHDFGEHEGNFFVAMENSEGVILDSFLKEKKRLAVDTFIPIAISIAETLAFFHGHNVFHGGIKPENFMVLPSGNGHRVKVFDFQMSLLKDISRASHETLLRIFSYLAPEQSGVLRRPIDVKSDIYSLGILFYHLLAGRLPYEHDDVYSLMHLHIASHPLPLARHNPLVPDAIDTLIQKMLDKEPGDRFHSCDLLAEDLKSITSRRARGEQDSAVVYQVSRTPEISTGHIRFVGRSREKSALLSVYQETVEGNGSIVFISGEAGIGKSRLVETVREELNRLGSIFLHADYKEIEHPLPYTGIFRPLQRFFHFMDLFSAETRRSVETKIRETVGELGSLFALHLPKIQEIVSPDHPVQPLSGEQEKIRFDEVVMNLLAALASHFPALIIFIDNVQWADNDTMLFLKKISRLKRTGNILFIITARTRKEAPRSPEPSPLDEILAGSNTRTMELAPLSLDEVRQMITSMLGDDTSELALLGEIVFKKTAGNALFVKEFVSMLLRDGMIKYSGGWQIDLERIRLLPFTDNVASLLLRLIEALPEKEHEILSAASVFGKEFDFSALVDCFKEFSREECFLAIEKAKTDNLLLSDGEKIHFSHDTIHQYFYSLIPDKKRARYHEKTARYYENRPADTDQLLYNILFHYRQTKDEKKKMEYLMKAGRFAEERTSFHDALQFYQEVLVLSARHPERLSVPVAELHERMADSLKHLGNYNAATEHYARAITWTGDPPGKVQLYQKLGYAQAAGGAYENAIDTLVKSLSLLGQRVPANAFVFGVKLMKELVIQFFHSRLTGFLVNQKKAKVTDPDFQKQKLFQMIGWVCLWAMKRELLIYSHFKALNFCDRTGVSEEGIELLLTHCAVLASINGPSVVIRLLYTRIARFMKRIKESLSNLHFPKIPYALFLAVEGGLSLDRQSIEKIGEALNILRRLHTVTYLQEISNCASQVFETHGRFDLLRGLGREVAEKALLYGNRLLKSIGDLYEGIALTYQGKRTDAVTLLESAFESFARVSDNVNCQYARLFLVKAYGRCGDYDRASQVYDAAVTMIRKEHQTHPMVIARIYPFFLEELLERFIPFATTAEEKRARLREAVYCFRKCKSLTRTYDSHRGMFFRLSAKYHALVKHNRKKAGWIFREGERFFTDSHEHYNKGMMNLFYADFLKEEEPLAALVRYEKAHLELEKCGAMEMQRAEAGVREIHKIKNDIAITENEAARPFSSGDSDSFTITRELDTILDISRKLGIVDDLDVLTQEVLDQAIKLVGAEQGQLFINDGEKLIPTVHRTADGANTLPVSMGVVSMVAATGEPLVISDARNDHRLEMDPCVVEYGLKSILCVPMSSHKKRVGIIYLSNHYVGGLFSEHELDLLCAMAGQAAVAIENSRLFREMSRLKLYLQSIIESMPGAIIALDKKGRITYSNSAAVRFFPELETKRDKATVWHVVPFLSKYHKVFLEVLEENRPVEFQRETFNKHILRITIFPLTAEESSGAVLKINDITEPEKIQQHLIQAQKMEAIETLVGGLAHDFNNILSGMMMTIDYIQQYVLLPGERFTREDIEEELSIISTSIERASNLVQQLLTISMRKEISVVSVDLSAAVERVVKICKQSFDKSIDFSITPADGTACILADAAQLEQVILNICINASHAMTIMRPPGQSWGGRLKIGIKGVNLDKPVGNGFSEAITGDFRCLSIEDTGVGMDDETLKKIFEPFFTTKETGKGSGLGLAMVYSIVRRFNGHINVYSEPGKGTTFHIYFPVDKQENMNGVLEKSDPIRHQGSGVALVVDDEEYIRHSLERILRRAGYDVQIASNGADALRLFETHRDRISVVLLDMVMPKESGKTVFLEMMRQEPKTKVILMSGFRKDQRAEEVLAMGTCLFLEKPFNQEDLFNAIDQIVK